MSGPEIIRSLRQAAESQRMLLNAHPEEMAHCRSWAELYEQAAGRLEQLDRLVANLRVEVERWEARDEQGMRACEAVWRLLSPRDLREAGFGDVADAMERAARGG